MINKSYLTPEIKSLIGKKGPVVSSSDSITNTEIRRFIQATMNPNPIFWNAHYATLTKYEGIIAPPLFPLTYFRPTITGEDLLHENFSTTSNFDGFSQELLGLYGLPDLQIPLKRTLNGGSEIEFFQFARPGEQLTAQSTIIDISEKIGKKGHMVFITVETTFWNDQNAKLLTAKLTTIKR